LIELCVNVANLSYSQPAENPNEHTIAHGRAAIAKNFNKNPEKNNGKKFKHVEHLNEPYSETDSVIKIAKIYLPVTIGKKRFNMNCGQNK
jgi:hypothetical protein